jgi:drug/metabolite transporter (DMT)-like permease
MVNAATPDGNIINKAAMKSPHSSLGPNPGRPVQYCLPRCWSLAGIFIVFDLHPLAIVFYRSLFASLVFLPFLKRGEIRIGSPIVVAAITYTAAISAFVSANKLTSAANAIVLQYTAPVFVFLFSWLVLGEKISLLNGSALTIAMAGVAIISFDSAGRPEMAGVLLALLSGVLFAAYMVNLRRTQATSPVYLTWLINIVCALLLLPFVTTHLALTHAQIGILALMGAVQLGLPYFLFSKGLKTISVQEASLIALVIDPYGWRWLSAKSLRPQR